MSDVILTFGWREEFEGGGNQRGHLIKGSRPRGAEKRLQFRERKFDRIEVGAVGRQEPEVSARGFDGRPHLGVFVHDEVVHHDHIPRA